MTGAQIPKGTTRVVKVENTMSSHNHIVVTKQEKALHISFEGEHLQESDIILKAPKYIRSIEIGILASAGITKVPVYKRPKVAVLSTGNELVEPDVVPQKSQIRNINAYLLLGLLEKNGATGHYLGIAKDNYEHTYQLIQKGLKNHHILIVSGGMSMGDYDFVGQCLKEMGAEVYFDRIAVKPGKPTAFGKYKEKLIFGLPGNPVSALVIFHLLVKFALYGLQNYNPEMTSLKAEVESDFNFFNQSERDVFIPVRSQIHPYSNQITVSEIRYTGSSHIHAYANANAILFAPMGTEKISRGDTFYITPIA